MRALILTDNTISLERLPNLFGDGLNLRPGWRDEQRGPALLRGGHIRIGCTLIKGLRATTMLIIGNLGHGTKFNEFGECFVRLFGGGQFDNFPECGGLLAADGSQFAETVACIP